MKRLPALPLVKGRRFTAASRAAAAARATAAEAARAATRPVERALEADEHAFLVSKLRERLALLHAEGGEADAAGAPTTAEPAAAAATDPRLSQERRDAVRSSLKIVNDIESLRRKLAEIAYQPPKGMRRTPWIETLAVVAPAAVAAEGGEAGAVKQSSTPISVHADIEREAYFMRLTTAAATEGLRRLRQLRVKFTRPSDFYAEMLKSDEHMQRVRARVAEEQQQQQEFLEKKNRERNRKFHKQSGKKLLRAQEEARLRNLELKQLEAWKQQRRRGGDGDGDKSRVLRDSSNAGSGETASSRNKKNKERQTAAFSAGKPTTAVEAAFDQWLADREKQKDDKKVHAQRAKRTGHHAQSKPHAHAGRHTQKKHRRRK